MLKVSAFIYNFISQFLLAEIDEFSASDEML